jgi:lincosamide nucleotidyltransferase A/C/D/E
MEAGDVLDVLTALDRQDIYYWVDGGWGVDCLLGEQTRNHADLDLVVPRPQGPETHARLMSRGYDVIRDWLPTTIAFRDHAGREVDLHPVDMTEDGGGDQVLQDGSTWHYAPPMEGTIDGTRDRCAPAEQQIYMHLGYEPRPWTSPTYRASPNASACPAPSLRELWTPKRMRAHQGPSTPTPPSDALKAKLAEVDRKIAPSSLRSKPVSTCPRSPSSSIGEPVNAVGSRLSCAPCQGNAF